MDERPDGSFSASLFGVIAGTRRAQSIIRAVAVALIIMASVLLFSFAALIILRASSGECVKIFGLELGCVASELGEELTSPSDDKSAGANDSFDPEQLNDHWFHYRIASTRIADCNKIASTALSVAGFENVRSNFDSHRGSLVRLNSAAKASATCVKDSGSLVIYGEVTSNSQQMASDLGTKVAESIIYEREKRKNDFLAPEYVSPFYKVDDAWLAYTTSTTEGECGRVAKNALSYAGVGQITLDNDWAYGKVNQGDVFAVCINGIEGYPVAIAVVGLGGDKVKVQESVNAAESYIERLSIQVSENEMAEVDAAMELEDEVVVVPSTQGMPLKPD
jgi:hypothetical protein